MSTQRFQPDSCKKCGGRMRRGIAMTSTRTQAVPGFTGDLYSTAASSRLVTVAKCERCGWSVRKVDAEE